MSIEANNKLIIKDDEKLLKDLENISAYVEISDYGRRNFKDSNT
jgi:hypothetical protein